MKCKTVITGWYRGGLGYVHKLLNLSGIDAGLTFADVVNIAEFEDRLDKAKEVEIAPSFPTFLSHPAMGGVKAFFVLRNPMRVYNSLFHAGLFHNEKDTIPFQFSWNTIPEFPQYRGMPSQATAQYVYSAYRLYCVNRFPEINLVRIEDGPAKLLNDLGFKVDKIPFLYPDVNASNCLQTSRYYNFLPHSRDLMMSIMQKTGYYSDSWHEKSGDAHHVSDMWNEGWMK